MLTIRLLGDFYFAHGDEPPATFGSERLRSLLGYLLLHRRAPQSRQLVASRLWPDSGDTQARTNLRNLLFTLRQSVPNADCLLVIANGTLQWAPGIDWRLDVADFARLLAQAREAAQIEAVAEERQALEAAVELYQGELLPGVYDDWILSLREEFQREYQEALSRLVTLLDRLDDARAAVRYAQRMIQQDPLDETAYVHLMRLHARSGDRAGVRRVYEQCVDVLQRELDVEPDEETTAVYEEALRAEATETTATFAAPGPFALRPLQTQLSAAPQPAPAPARQRPPLPMPATPFVGRQREMAELAALLAVSNCRLITILGPGGIGKSHLALQVARAHQRVFADGVAFVPLAAVTDADQLISALATALGFSFYGAADPESQLRDYLRQKQLLLVLDTAEHLLRYADLLVELLAEAPDLTILVTSRERINVQEEWVYLLHGLPLPTAADEIRSAGEEENDCLALFVQVARKVQSGFALTDQNRGIVSRICHLVEGVPLGIQLAASWARVLAPADIAAEIERSLAFLTASQRNAPERHRSLRAVFDHSWALLSPLEQEIYSRLAVFPGHFSREAAERVAGADLLTLTSLLDKSLLRSTADSSQGGRYHLHEILRHFAAQKLNECSSSAAIQRQHSCFYLAFLHQQEARLFNAEQVAMLEAVQIELANVRAAWRWAADNSDDEGLFMGLRPLFYFYYRRARYQEGAQDLGYAIDRVRSRADSALKRRLLGRLLARQGMLLHMMGHYSEARTSIEEGLPHLRDHGDADELTVGLIALGHVLDDLGAMESSSALLHEGLALARAGGNIHRTAVALDILCSHSWRRSHYTEAKRYAEESIALYRQCGDLWGLAHALNNKANASIDASEHRTAIDIYEESLSIYQQLGNQGGVAVALNNLGHSYLLLGETELAWTYLDRSLTLQRQLGGAPRIARTLNNQGHVAYLLGRYGEARRLSEESLAMRRTMGTPLAVANSLYTLALIVMEMGEWSQAEAYWHEALALYEQLGYAPETANCLNELAHVALLRGETAEADWLLEQSMTRGGHESSPAGHARALMVQGLRNRRVIGPIAALASLHTALTTAIAAHERVLALDILLAMVENAAELLDPEWRVQALCLLLHNPQSRQVSRERARRLLVWLGVDSDAELCGSVAAGGLQDNLQRLAAQLHGQAAC